MAVRADRVVLALAERAKRSTHVNIGIVKLLNLRHLFLAPSPIIGRRLLGAHHFDLALLATSSTAAYLRRLMRHQYLLLI